MVTKSGVAKLCDLGLAKQSQSSEEANRPLTSLAIGTPHYIAPEQAKGEKNVDYRSDLYSLGVTFYHMLVGKTPFDAPTSAAVMVHHISSAAKSPCELDTLIPLGYGYIITKLMAKNPLERYQSSEELIEDLETLKSGNAPKATVFTGKSSCLAPTTTENHPHETDKITGQHPSVITSKQTTQITTPLKTVFLSTRLLAPQMQPVWIATIAIGILVIVAVGICFILK
jgi:serine/threonine-protein kinase